MILNDTRKRIYLYFYHEDGARKAVLEKNPANTREKMAISLIRILSDGPDVSFSGSPTVSPITAAA